MAEEADVPIFAEIEIGKDQFREDLERMGGQVQELAQRAATTPIDFPVRLNLDAARAQLGVFVTETNAALTDATARLSQAMVATPFRDPATGRFGQRPEWVGAIRPDQGAFPEAGEIPFSSRVIPFSESQGRPESGSGAIPLEGEPNTYGVVGDRWRRGFIGGRGVQEAVEEFENVQPNAPSSALNVPLIQTGELPFADETRQPVGNAFRQQPTAVTRAIEEFQDAEETSARPQTYNLAERSSFVQTGEPVTMSSGVEPYELAPEAPPDFSEPPGHDGGLTPSGPGWAGEGEGGGGGEGGEGGFMKGAMSLRGLYAAHFALTGLMRLGSTARQEYRLAEIQEESGDPYEQLKESKHISDERFAGMEGGLRYFVNKGYAAFGADTDPDEMEAEYKEGEKSEKQFDARKKQLQRSTEQRTRFDDRADERLTEATEEASGDAHATRLAHMNKERDEAYREAQKIADKPEQYGYQPGGAALTTELARIRNTADATYAAQQQVIFKEQHEANLESQTQYTQAYDIAHGDSDAARKAGFDRKMDREQAEEYKKGQNAGDAFKFYNRPLLESNEAREVAGERTFNNAEFAQRRDDIVAEANEGLVRARGDTRLASRQAKEREIDDTIAKLRDQANLADSKGDSVKAGQLRSTADTEEAARPKILDAQDVANARQTADELIAINEDANQRALRSNNQFYAAHESAANQAFDRRIRHFREEGRDAEANAEQLDKDYAQEERDKDHDRAIQNVYREGADTRLRAEGKGTTAELRDLEFRESEDMRKATGDSDMQRAVRSRYGEQLNAFMRQHEGHPEMTTTRDIYMKQLLGIYDPHRQDMAKAMQEADRAKHLNNMDQIDHGDPATKGLDNGLFAQASKDFAEGAKNLKDTIFPPLTVVN